MVAYNKIDVPDSGDFVDVMREELLKEGVAPDYIFPVSAATGQGILELVRRVRLTLDGLGPPQQLYETNAVNQKKLPGRYNEDRIDDFTVEVEYPSGPEGRKVMYVEGKALAKFAQVCGTLHTLLHMIMIMLTAGLPPQMTNWDYYEAVKRFQKVLEAAGVNSSLRSLGVKEGDTVVINNFEFNWQDDQSEAALFQAFKDDMRNRGRRMQGTASWPAANPSSGR